MVITFYNGQKHELQGLLNPNYRWKGLGKNANGKGMLKGKGKGKQGKHQHGHGAEQQLDLADHREPIIPIHTVDSFQGSE